jgi:hypothetical protein
MYRKYIHISIPCTVSLLLRSTKKTQNRQISFAADLVAYDEECENPETLKEIIRWEREAYIEEIPR